ncbi:MAG TPA: hypothetical protein VNM69_16640 [Bacillus sp. (in: firmicutes)]|uniref:hypothetical protein n=1 Tax=Bacillus litorisediminis TaxID=2922713 RepID=UPI001FB01A07|nr:hypothetical protein [Bacillus litorisediminis]HWO77494.1 hypothetical protein [Bacillus sp. (in: firmicutes)]
MNNGNLSLFDLDLKISTIDDNSSSILSQTYTHQPSCVDSGSGGSAGGGGSDTTRCQTMG